MEFHRSYDISCLTNELARSCLQNAIDAVNLACSPEKNAWDYIESREILSDYTRAYYTTDSMKAVLYAHMGRVGHTPDSLEHTINTLVSVVTDYSNWRRECEEENSKLEGDIRTLDRWRQDNLIPYHRSMSGGGNRASVGPILDAFLSLKDTLDWQHSPSALSIEEELNNLLGSTDEGRLEILTEILQNYNTLNIAKYKDRLQRKIDYETKNGSYHTILVNEQIPILRGAIESRNPGALRAALNPGWSSVRLEQLKEYKEARQLLDSLLA